jgi:hypothetical protein
MIGAAFVFLILIVFYFFTPGVRIEFYKEKISDPRKWCFRIAMCAHLVKKLATGAPDLKCRRLKAGAWTETVVGLNGKPLYLSNTADWQTVEVGYCRALIRAARGRKIFGS